MPTSVSSAEDEDMKSLFTIASLAFGKEEPFFNAAWPRHWEDTGREKGGERFKNIKKNDRAATYLKAFDTSTGEIVGMAKWNIYVDHLPNLNSLDEEEEISWETEDEKEYCQYLSKQFFAERRDAISMSKGNIVCLDILAVAPAHQRQGVGTALVEWGTRRADELDLEAVVESSKYGKGLYEKHGFVYTKQVDIQVPQKWAHVGGQEFAWLIRPRKGV